MGFGCESGFGLIKNWYEWVMGWIDMVVVVWNLVIGFDLIKTIQMVGDGFGLIKNWYEWGSCCGLVSTF